MRINEESRNRRFRAQLVQRAIETLAPDAPLLAPQLARHMRAEGLTWTELAASLGTTSDGLNHIALCRPPRPDSFVADVEAIARDYVAPERLLNLLRQLQILEAFASHTAEASAYDADATGGMLLAARDRIEIVEETEEEKLKGETGRQGEEEKTEEEKTEVEPLDHRETP